jgi:hypothetical protein
MIMVIGTGVLLKDWLPANILHKIATVLPPEASAGEDKRI